MDGLTVADRVTQVTDRSVGAPGAKGEETRARQKVASEQEGVERSEHTRTR